MGERRGERVRKKEGERKEAWQWVSLYDVDTGGSDAYGNGVEISHLEPADRIATHSQDTVLPLNIWDTYTINPQSHPPTHTHSPYSIVYTHSLSFVKVIFSH